MGVQVQQKSSRLQEVEVHWENNWVRGITERNQVLIVESQIATKSEVGVVPALAMPSSSTIFGDRKSVV